MSTHVLDTILSSVDYKESEFSHLSVRQLQGIHSSFSGYSVVDPAVEAVRKQYIEGRLKPEIDRFKIFILALKQKKAKGQILEAARIEETGYAKGSQIAYTKEKVSVTYKTGENVEFPNSVVPDPNVIVRPYAGIIISFLSRVVSVDAGVLVANVDQNHQFQEAFSNYRSIINLPGLAEFGLIAKTLIEDDDYWKSLQIRDRSQLTGSKLVAFFSHFVNSCKWESYFIMHTLIVLKGLRVFAYYNRNPCKVGHVLHYVDPSSRKKIPVVDPLCYSIGRQVPKDWALTKDRLAGAKACLKYLGYIGMYYGKGKQFQNSVTKISPKIADVRKAIQDGDSLRMGHGSALSMLADSVGFSGVPTPSTREAHLFVSLALSCINRFGEVDIHLPTVGYLDLMISTISENRVYMGKYTTEKELQAAVKLILPYDKYPSDDRRIWCSTITREKAFQVLVSDRSNPTFTEKTTDSMIEELCGIYMARVQSYSRYAILIRIFGEEIFSKGLYIYRYGRPADYRCIVSTDQLTLLGLSYKKEKDEVKREIVQVPMEVIKDHTELYKAIVLDNCFKNAYFLTPTSHYSHISNLLVVRTKGIVLTEGETLTESVDFTARWDEEDGELDRQDPIYDDPMGVPGDTGEYGVGEEWDDDRNVSFNPPLPPPLAGFAATTTAASTAAVSSPTVAGGGSPVLPIMRPPPLPLPSSSQLSAPLAQPSYVPGVSKAGVRRDYRPSSDSVSGRSSVPSVSDPGPIGTFRPLDFEGGAEEAADTGTY